MSNACEVAVGPFTAPMNPPFQASFGTAIQTSAYDLTQNPPLLTTGWTEVSILLTAEPVGCPSTWLGGGDPQVEHDVHYLWLAIEAPSNGPFVGTYQACCSPYGANIYGKFGPFIVSGFFPKGTVVVTEGFNTLAEWATGTITITRFVDGKEVAGSFDAHFPDGTDTAGDFDVPVCVAACVPK